MNKTCENCNDVIFWRWKKIFLSLFIDIINYIDDLNKDYYIWIIKKIQDWIENLDVNECIDLRNLLDDKFFLKKALEIFQNWILMSKNWFSQLEQNNINIKNLKNELKKYIDSNMLESYIHKTQNNVWEVLNQDEFIDWNVIFENDFLVASSIQITLKKKEEYWYYKTIHYESIDFSYYDFWYILIKNKKWETILLNIKWEYITTKWWFEGKKFIEPNCDFLAKWIIIETNNNQNLLCIIKDSICHETLFLKNPNYDFVKYWYIFDWQKEIDKIYLFPWNWDIIDIFWNYNDFKIIENTIEWDFIANYENMNWKKRYIIFKNRQILYDTKKEIFYDLAKNYYYFFVFWIRKKIWL